MWNPRNRATKPQKQMEEIEKRQLGSKPESNFSKMDVRSLKISRLSLGRK